LYLGGGAAAASHQGHSAGDRHATREQEATQRSSAAPVALVAQVTQAPEGTTFT
jgi:hypothetical protein